MRHIPVVARGAIALAIVVVTSSCGDLLTAGGRAPLTLSFANRTSASSFDFGPSTALIPITSGGHTLDLTAVMLSVSKLELETSAGVETEFGCREDKGCSAVLAAPLDVDLKVNGGVVTVQSSVIPAGTYRSVEMKFSTVRLRGTYDTQPFDVVVPVNVEREMEFDPPITVGGTSTKNLTIEVSTTLWLRNADGSLVDPRRLATDSALRAQVASRIRASLRAFRDNDRDDLDDDHEDSDHGGD